MNTEGLLMRAFEEGFSLGRDYAEAYFGDLKGESDGK